MNHQNRCAALLAAAMLFVPAGMTAASAQTAPNPAPAAPAAPAHAHHGAMKTALRNLNLSDAQRSQIKQIMQTTRAQNQNADPQTRHTNMRNAWNQVRTQVLTDDQRSQFDAQIKAYRAAHPNGAAGSAPGNAPANPPAPQN